MCARVCMPCFPCYTAPALSAFEITLAMKPLGLSPCPAVSVVLSFRLLLQQHLLHHAVCVSPSWPPLRFTLTFPFFLTWSLLPSPSEKKIDVHHMQNLIKIDKDSKMATFKVKFPSIASRPSLSCALVPFWSPHRLTQTGLEPSLHAGHIVVDLEILASSS